MPELIDRLAQRLAQLWQPLGAEDHQRHQEQDHYVEPMITEHGTSLFCETRRCDRSIASVEFE
jgi:hypothetical protein